MHLQSPPGSLTAGGVGGTVEAGGVGASLSLQIMRYDENQTYSSGIYNVSREWGGSTAQEVLDSAYIAERDTTIANRGEAAGTAVKIVPDIGYGTVSDGVGGFVLAGTGEYWYWGAQRGKRKP